MKLFRGALFRVMQCFNTAKFAALESRDLHDATHIKLSDTVQLEEFEPYIKETLKRELDQKSKALWVHLNQSNLGLLPMLCNNEFKIHHGFDSNVVLYRWLRQEEDMVPIFSRFYVAAGAVVIKDGRLLMVQEKNGARKNDWGVPGGLCNLNEPLADAAARELREETGLVGEYRYLIFFRELENQLYSGTDFYFASLLQVEDISTLKLCERELMAYQWLDLNKCEQFIQNHSIRGTQLHLLKYLAELHQNKFRFNEQMPNQTISHVSTIRGGAKYFKEHRLVNLS